MNKGDKKDKRPYEPPKIYDLGVDFTQALGQTCPGGGGETGDCPGGGTAGTDCGGGGSASGSCPGGGNFSAPCNTHCAAFCPAPGCVAGFLG